MDDKLYVVAVDEYWTDILAVAVVLAAAGAGAVAVVAVVDTQCPYINQHRRHKQNSMMNHMGWVRLLPLVVVVVVEVVEMVLAVVEFEPAVVFGSQPHDCKWMRCSSYDWMVTVAGELMSFVVQICYRMFAPIAMTVRMIQPFTHIIVDWRKLFTLMGIHIFLIIEELYKTY